jgi:hypothetical protein
MLRVSVVVLFALIPVHSFAQPAEPETAEPGEPAEPAPQVEPAAPPTTDQGADRVESESAHMAIEPAPEPNKFPGGWRFMISDLTIFRLNPIGLETRSRIGFQKKLYPSTKKVTENNFFFAGLFPKLNRTPARHYPE